MAVTCSEVLAGAALSSPNDKPAAHSGSVYVYLLTHTCPEIRTARIRLETRTLPLLVRCSRSGQSRHSLHRSTQSLLNRRHQLRLVVPVVASYNMRHLN